jgi:elongator complex protein 3
MRELGCTRVEIGVQAIDDEILKKNKRGHDVSAVVKATQLLRDYGLKITYHLMPGLPGSNTKKDLAMFKELFSSPNFQPDQIKFYPTVVTKGSLLYRWWKQGKYKPYSDEELQGLIIDCKKIIPKYVRIIRLIRDIPGESIEAGNMVTNLRQIMKDKGVECKCIRCRECRDKKINAKDLEQNITEYRAGHGKELFISFDSKDKKTLFGFLRLYLPDKNKTHFMKKGYEFLSNSAIIRELHVYGELVSKGSAGKTQHTGLGARLIKKAEKIAKSEKYDEITVISGVGVRNYYRKFNYKNKRTYLTKKIS